MTSPLRAMNNALNMTISSFEAMQKATNQAMNTSSIQAARAELNKAEIAMNQFEDEIREANEEAKKMPGSFGGVEGVLSKLKGLAAGVGLAFGANKIIEIADTMTLTTARLDLINDGLQSTAELQDMIAASANRARSSYQSTAEAVSKLGVLAGNAFSGNEEMIAFTELMNKNFVIGGASIQEQTAAMYQLTQAMAAGRLQGDEFRSIMENAPLLAQAIADYMGKPMGELREMSSQGLITAEVIKGAMFASANEINDRFAQMPMTFGQVGTILKNTLLQTFEPVIQAIGRGSQWIYDNWSTLEPVFLGLATATGAYAVALGLQKVAAVQAMIAEEGLRAVMMKNPYMWVALIIGVLVGMIYKWVQSVGGIRVAWLLAMDAVMSAAGNAKVAVLESLESMINGAISRINEFISLLNKIPGVNIDMIGNVSFAAKAAAENEAKAKARDRIINQAQLDAAKKSTADGMGFDWDSLMSGVENTAGNTAKMADSMEMAEESLEYMRDIAEQEAINRYTTASINVEFGGITNNVNSELDLDGVVDYMATKVEEAMEISAERVRI
jgi:tape measure domain-containing protein